MEKIGHGKLGSWIAPVGVLLCLMVVITAQPGFLSISCGGKTNYTENSITWVSDADYIDVGEAVDLENFSQVLDYGFHLHNLRLFPKPLNKSCYQLPVVPDVPYLLRLWFAVGNYSRLKQSQCFSFSIETLGFLATVERTKRLSRDASYDERIVVSSGTVLYICLIRTTESCDPYISAIELRRFQNGMYGHAKPGKMLWPGTYDVAGSSTIRYPLDKFDRIWTVEYLNAQTIDAVDAVSSQVTISTDNTKNLPPLAIMQTAWLGNSRDISVDSARDTTIDSSPQGTRSLLVLYFAEIQTLNTSESRSFYVTINGERQSETIYTLVPNNSTLELTFLPHRLDYFNIVKAPNSTLRPILNAFEYHWLFDTDKATYSQDIDALHSIKMSFDIKDWISDPCYLIPWKGIRCENRSSAIRISEIDLSGRNLAGPVLVPNGIGQLTALVNVSLESNHLIGTFPNLTNLTMLERLYLQNNNLSGSVPEWLSELKSLKELNIEYNNFSGAIPAQLFLNCSLKLSYSGNLYLLMDKRKCNGQENSSNHKNNKNKLKVVLASGIVTATLALIAGVVCLKKLKRSKGDGVARKSSGVENEAKPFMYQDNRMIVVQNPSKSTRVFTLEEMMAATQNFSREIGRGGFGSVFFGKLPEGRDIAVKVLSIFSRQGVHEFWNEADLLSGINHRSLVSLVGYCNETREVMLIYEHMSGGSLRDHLYGVGAENSKLNWKRRLKIALDAGHGLEYLHMGCTPKIIHRDVKTANILLDSNMNGKLADFGLARMTIEEATHITTAVKGTLGYMDPEYFSTKMLTEKSDVYSFGVVLLEIICGRQPIDQNFPEGEVNMIRWVTPYLAEMDDNASKITEIIDKRLGVGGGYDLKSMTLVAEVAMRSVQAEPSSRPSMREVVGELKKAMGIEYKASISEEIGIESGDFLAGPMDSPKRRGMEWGDNSSNMSKVGR